MPIQTPVPRVSQWLTRIYTGKAVAQQAVRELQTLPTFIWQPAIVVDDAGVDQEIGALTAKKLDDNLTKVFNAEDFGLSADARNSLTNGTRWGVTIRYIPNDPTAQALLFSKEAQAKLVAWNKHVDQVRK